MIYKNLLFDLDGTVMDSGEGIMESAQYALNHFGFENEPADTLRKFVGPSLFHSFTHLYGMEEEEAKKAVQLYRNVYESGNKFHAIPYEGIQDTLKILKEMQYEIFLVTSKPRIFAEQILDHFHLAEFFSHVVGPKMADPSSDKARLINKAITDMNLFKEETIMIGDTKYDIQGAIDSGIDSLGVTYGYGHTEDLGQATYVVDSVQELKNMFAK